MNDFTKEELMNINDAILYSALLVSREKILLTIREKIQSMIDNYDAKVIQIWHCEKCGHIQ